MDWYLLQNKPVSLNNYENEQVLCTPMPQLILFTVSFLNLIALVKLFSSDPGRIVEDTIIATGEKIIVDNSLYRPGCEQCSNTVAHIQHEGQCVYKYDHECGWVCNTIGYLNKSTFLFYLFIQAVSSISGFSNVLSSISIQSKHLNYKGFQLFLAQNMSSVYVKFLLVKLFIDFFSSLISVLTLFSHLRLILTGHSLRSKEESVSLMKTLKKKTIVLVRNEKEPEIIEIFENREEELEGFSKLQLKEAVKIAQKGCYSRGINGIKQAISEGKWTYRWKVS
ncbi:Palmitoyltransferase_ZDHHC4 [Hexamita inflata]|uniref:Palmitoyltransferase n=1 Tax=Hexamita inflata TaxID=28002 RepID=A0AA86PLD3_9EUKA|nr:Palmitoyltransferase ZDHHC4 [Hexamita inflata]